MRVSGGEGTGLHEEGPQRMLEGGDRTMGVGEGGLEMCEDVRRRSLRGLARQLGRRTPPRQCRADLALAPGEPFPDALPGSVTQMAVDGADGSADAAGRGASEEAPQTAGGQAESTDFVGDPDAERAATTATHMAVAAKDSASPQCFSPRAAVVESVQTAVPNQRTHHFAVRAGRLLEPFRQRDPFVGATVKPLLPDHSDHAPRKTSILAVDGRGGVVAGYDQDDPLSGVRGKNPGAEVVLAAGSVAEFSV
jgi:hypothetical protein